MACSLPPKYKSTSRQYSLASVLPTNSRPNFARPYTGKNTRNCPPNPASCSIPRDIPFDGQFVHLSTTVLVDTVSHAHWLRIAQWWRTLFRGREGIFLLRVVLSGKSSEDQGLRHSLDYNTQGWVPPSSAAG